MDLGRYRHRELAHLLRAAPEDRDVQQFEIPPETVVWLKKWWLKCGRPTGDVPVFPTYRKGRKSGTPKGAKVSYRSVTFARTLRRALKRALVGAVTPERLNLLLEGDTKRFKPVDFHSFRRNVARALKKANVNMQQSMDVLSHTDPKVHFDYSDSDEVVVVPDAVIPRKR